MMRPARLISFLVVGAIVIAFVAYCSRVGDPASSWRTAELDRGEVRSVVTATGTVRPLVVTNVSTQVSGQVAEVLVDFNDPVYRNQCLARLDPQTFIARVREAEAELEVARAEFASRESAIEKANARLLQQEARREVAASELASARARYEDVAQTTERRRALAERGGVSASELQSAETDLASAEALLRAAEGELNIADAEIAAAKAEVATARSLADHGRATIRQREAALDEARINLGRTEILSPLDGTVIRREVEEGQTVAASLQAPTLFTIARDLTRMRVETHVDEADVGRLRAGQPAVFSVDAYPGRSFDGRVTAIHKAPNLVHNVVTYTVMVDAENPDLTLFPGMTAIVRIVVEVVPDGLRIPNAALRFVPPAALPGQAAEGMAGGGDGRVRVWLLDDTDSPTATWVLTGASDERFTLMIDGDLEAGERVITGHAGTE